MKATGLDLSITATGVAIGPLFEDTFLVKTSDNDGDLRLPVIAGQVRVRANGSDLVLIEDLPTHGKAAGITGMVHGIVRGELIEQGLSYATVPPATLKKYATGAGNADKSAMILAAFKRGGVEFKDNNQCDAWWLWLMAMDYLGEPVIDLPKNQRASLSKITLKAR